MQRVSLSTRGVEHAPLYRLLQPTPCRYFHKGSLAYVGGDQAVMDIPKVGPIFGREAGVMWKGYETFAQVRGRGCVHRELTAHAVQLPVMSGSYSTLAPMSCPAGCCALQISLRNQLLVANDW